MILSIAGMIALAVCENPAIFRENCAENSLIYKNLKVYSVHVCEN